MRLIYAFVLLLYPTVSVSGESTDKMSDCLVKQTTGQDRIDLVRWIVLAYSKHPDVATFVKTDSGIDESLHKTTAVLFSRLMLEDCKRETKAAILNDGNAAIEDAFQTLGETAAFELMQNSSVNETILEFPKYLDQKRFRELFE